MPHKTPLHIPCTDVYYSLLLHVSATLYCHLQGVTYFIEVYMINCKQPYVKGKCTYWCLSTYSVNIEMLIFNYIRC